MTHIDADQLLNSLDEQPEKMLIIATLYLTDGGKETKAKNIVMHDLGKYIEKCRELIGMTNVKRVVVSGLFATEPYWDSEVEQNQMVQLWGAKGKPADEPMDPVQKYYCDTGVKDIMTVYPSERETGEYPTVSFVIESNHCRSVKASVIATMDDIRRLRNQLNQLLGE